MVTGKSTEPGGCPEHVLSGLPKLYVFIYYLHRQGVSILKNDQVKLM